MTPTSATGRTKVRDRSGFTLVELMMVVAIIGLAAGAVVLTLPDPRPSADKAAETLAARLNRAREEAILSNRPIAVTADETGYHFTAFDGREWQALSDGPFRPQPMEGVAITWPEPEGRLVFDPTGAADPASLTVTASGRHRTVSVDGAGEARLDG